MPYCIAYCCANDTHDAPSEVSFHHLMLKKPTVKAGGYCSVKLTRHQTVLS